MSAAYVLAVVGDDDKVPAVLSQVRTYFEEVKGLTVSVSLDQSVQRYPNLGGSTLMFRAGRRISDEIYAIDSGPNLALINNTLLDEVSAGREMLENFKLNGEKAAGIEVAHQLISVETLAQYWMNVTYHHTTVLLFPGQTVSEINDGSLVTGLLNNMSWLNCASVDDAADRLARNLESYMGIPSS